MLILKELIIQGWQKDIKQCPLPLFSYWNYRDELSIVDSCEGEPYYYPNKILTRAT